MKKHTPGHIPHQYSKKMSEKSTVLPLSIQFKTKHADCLDIMDTYEKQLVQLHNDAFGNTDILRKFRVPIGGDQLTRVRLQEAKNLRTLSVIPERRLSDLTPIVCEMWHNKQDFLEKCFKTLYKTENSPGTLYHFKTVLHRSNVNGKVKGKFQPHHDLLVAVGEGMITEQVMEFFKMEDCNSEPQHSKLTGLLEKPVLEQRDILKDIVREFLSHFGYGNVGRSSNVPQKLLRYKVSGINPDGTFILQQICDPPVDVDSESDDLKNYCMNLCHWALHIMEIDDTVNEGDTNRLILNYRYSIPFFYSHSPLSKYMVENIDYVLKTEHLLSPLQRLRVLEGSFVNKRGGLGQNVESDLVQEHSVCNQKTLIRTLGANKSEAAMSRGTGAADTISDICHTSDKSLGIKAKSGRHSKSVTQTDLETIAKTLRKLRPFRTTPGRKCPGFKTIQAMPLMPKTIPVMKERVGVIIRR